MTGASSSKLGSHFQALDRMNVSSSVRALSSEDLQQARHAANRILLHVSAQVTSLLSSVFTVSFIQNYQTGFSVLVQNRDIATSVPSAVLKSDIGTELRIYLIDGVK